MAYELTIDRQAFIFAIRTLVVFYDFEQSTVSCFDPLGHPPSLLLNLLGSLWASPGLPLGSSWAVLGSLGPL